MEWKNFIKKDHILLLQETTKTEALLRIVECLEDSEIQCDRNELIKSIFYREQLMSTGIGLGIGIPHVRIENIVKPVMAIGIQKQGIKDYSSIDDQPVKIIIMILVGKNRHREYIRLLSQITGFLKTGTVIDSLLRAENREEVLSLLTGQGGTGKGMNSHD